MSEERDSKRIKLDAGSSGNLQSLDRQISPPPSKRDPKASSKQNTLEPSAQDERETVADNNTKGPILNQTPAVTAALKSPFRLTSIQDLPDDCNIDAVTLDDILGRENLKEVWLFDYLFDLDFVM